MCASLLNGRGNPARAGGFTLLEILMAVGILGIALLVVMRGHIMNLSGMRYTRDRETAFMLAENLLVEYELEAEVSPGAESGDFGEDFPGYSWQRTVEPLAYEGREIGGVFRVEVSVSWNEDGSVSAVTFLEGL